MEEPTTWVVDPDPAWRGQIERTLLHAGFRAVAYEAIPQSPPWRETDILIVAADLVPVPEPPATVVVLVTSRDAARFTAACEQHICWCLPKDPTWLPHLPAILSALTAQQRHTLESTFYARVLEQIEEGVVIEDPETRLIYVSPRAAQILGGSPQALLGRSSLEFIHPDDRERVVTETSKRPHGIASQYEARVMREDGSVFPVWVFATPIFEEGRFAGVFVVFRDLTHEKRLQQRAQAFQRIAAAIAEERGLIEIFQEAREVLRTAVRGAVDALFLVLDPEEGELHLVDLDEDVPLRNSLKAILGTSAVGVSFPLSQIPIEWYDRLKQGRPIVSLEMKDLQEVAGRVFSPEVIHKGLQVGRIASLVGLPLVAGGLLRGVVALMLDQPHILQEDLDLAMAVTHLVAAAIESHSLLEQARHRTFALERLFQVAQAAALSTEPADLAHLAARQFIQAFGVERARISLFEPETGVMRTIADLRYDSGGGGFRSRDEKAVVSVRERPFIYQAIESQRPLQVVVSDLVLKEQEKAYLRAREIKTLIVLPMMTKGRIVGVIELGDLRAEQRLDEEQLNLAMTMSGQVAGVLENARLLAETRRRAIQLQTAAEITRDATGILDVERLISRAVELIRERFDLYYVGLFLLDESEEWAVLRAGTGEAGRRMLEAGHRLKVDGKSMIGWCIAHGEARIALDVGREAVRFDNPLLPETRSEIALPLISRGRVIGAMTIQSAQPAAFTEEDISVLQTMAGQLANAIENARLHENLRRHLTELSILYEIGQAIISVLDLRELIRVIHQEIRHFIPASHFYIALWSREADVIEVPLIVEEDRWLYDQTVGLDGVVGWVLRRGEPLLVGDVENESLPPGVRPLVVGEAGIRSLLVVPLILGDEVIGALSVQSKQAHAYTKQDLTFLTAVASQVAVALQNARLYAEARRRAEEMAALNAIAARLSQTLDLEEVLNTAIDEVVRALVVEAAAVSLLDEQKGELMIRAQRGLRNSYVGVRIPIDRGLSGHVVRTGEPLITGEVRDDPRLAVPAFSEEGIQAMALIPMRVRGRVVGVLSAMSHAPHEFTSREIAFLEAIASQVGMAVENARLFEAERSQRRMAETLRGVAAVLASSLQLGQVLQWLLEYLKELVPYDRATVMLLEGERLRVAATSGYTHLPDGREAVGHTVDLAEDPLLSRLIQGKEPVLVKDTATDPRWEYPQPMWITQSWIGIPLIVRGTVTGVLSLAREHSAGFTDEEMALAVDIASHAAVAIENARLYRKIQEHAARLKEAYDQLKEADRLKDEIVQNVSHELRTPLAFIKGYVELMKSGELGPLTPEQERSLEVVARRTDHLTRLVNDFVTLQVVSWETLNLQLVDMGQLARTAVEDCRSTAGQKGIEVRGEIPSDLPPVLVDPDRIGQVLDNLLTNAIKFSPQGGTITVRVREMEEWLRVEVSDTGIGIPADKLSRVFERFYQVDGTSRRRFGGVGLGLAIVKQIVEAHGGEVGVESTVGKGSTFYFTLPKRGQGRSRP
ncbi:MAG TPA: GAF domain-containing protein [Thermoflexia bacterium]|jgi:PAS domain S-box-containing protein|nr:GAF domain-containing protein [Thermoflexia bacterium]